MADPDKTTPERSPEAGQVGGPAPAPASGPAASELASPSEAPEGPMTEAREAGAGSRVLPLLAVLLPALFFFVVPPLARAGLWDPYELNVADLARRVALNLHGAANLALEGADNSLPHLNDLGRPQLPFTSIALGFKLFGLHEWAGRAPLALWGLLGVLATYGFVARLVDRRAGLFSAIALTTMPLYFVEARTMLGDIVTMSAFAMSFGGLAVAVFDRRDDGRSARVGRLLFAIVAAVGLLSGFFTRGAILGIAAPTMAVGVAYGIALTNGHRRFDGLAHAVGALALVVGLLFSWLGITALGSATPADLSPLVGAMIKTPAKYPTFDFEVGHLAASLAPWSAFIPFAFGRLFIAPPTRESVAFVRESETRTALLVGAAVAFFAHGWMAARTDLVAFAAPSILAAGCGIALRDYERGAHPSLAVGVGTSALLGLLHHEFHNLPEKAFQAFAIPGTTAFPETFKEQALSIWWIALGGFTSVVLLTFAERYRPRSLPLPPSVLRRLDAEARSPFDPKVYLRILLALRDAWDGMLALAYFAMVAGASLAGLVVWVGTRQHAKWMPTLSTAMRDFVLNAWWLTAIVPIAVIFGTFFWCDVWLWAFEGARPLSKSSFTRGFEPFEELGARLRDGRLGKTVPDLIMGRLAVTNEEPDDGLGPVALFILAPLMFLQVPAITFAALHHQGMKTYLALAFATPAGIALFLVLGLLGDLLRGSRPAFLALGATVVGAVLCTSYYPALANQLSPKEVFESFQRKHKAGEPLALFGVGGRTAAYYAGGQPQILHETGAAYDWLMSGEPGSRHFLAVRAEELARLNRTYRERNGTGQNLPVVDARSSQIILVASSLRDGEKNENPLGRIVLTAAPHPQHPLDVNLEDKLQVLGYDLVDAAGRPAERVAPGKKYHMKTYFKVLAPLSSDWEMFIHIDGFRKRHNGDHKVSEGKYPMTMWLKDDVVMDDHEFSLEPNFTPGSYTLYFGLFSGDTRLKVTSGPSDSDNRINGGPVKVQ